MEKELLENENIENIDDEVRAARGETESAKPVVEQTEEVEQIDESQWTVIKKVRHSSESVQKEDLPEAEVEVVAAETEPVAAETEPVAEATEPVAAEPEGASEDADKKSDDAISESVDVEKKVERYEPIRKSEPAKSPVKEAESAPKAELDEAEVVIAPVEKIDIPDEEEKEEEDQPDTKQMAAEAKRARKEARKEARAAAKEAKENERDHEDDGSVFKSKGFRKTWNIISFILLILAIGVPTALLLYIILYFFF